MKDDMYTDSFALIQFQNAKDIESRLNRECENEWSKNPDLCDLWRMYLFLADVEEAHSKMIHGNIATKNGLPDLNGDAATMIAKGDSLKVIDVVNNANNRLREISDEWENIKLRLQHIVEQLRGNQDRKDQEKRKADMEETIRKKRVADKCKAGRLGF